MILIFFQEVISKIVHHTPTCVYEIPRQFLSELQEVLLKIVHHTPTCIYEVPRQFLSGLQEVILKIVHVYLPKVWTKQQNTEIIEF